MIVVCTVQIVVTAAYDICTGVHTQCLSFAALTRDLLKQFLRVLSVVGRCPDSVSKTNGR